MTETTARLALIDQQQTSMLRATMTRLLHDLRSWVHAYPMQRGAEMPEHRLEWHVGSEGCRRGGPGETILAAIKAHPELWLPALPKDCCIVPRAQLVKAIGEDYTDALEHYAAMVVDREARIEQEAQEAERQRDRAG